MNRPDINEWPVALGLAVTLSAMLALATVAIADDCGEGNRIALPECATHTMTSNAFSITNQCWNPVKAKAIVENGSDPTKVLPGISDDATESERTLDNGVNDYSWPLKVESLHCCSVTDSHCDQTWASTEAAQLDEFSRDCRTAFYYSHAGYYCGYTGGDGDADLTTCNIYDVRCPDANGVEQSHGTVSGTVAEFEKARNCNGQLVFAGSC